MTQSIDPAKIPFAPGCGDDFAGVQTGDSRVDAFVYWLDDDVRSARRLAQICDAVGRRLSRADTEPAEFSGNAWVAIVTPDAVNLRSHVNDWRESLPLADAALLLHRYWDYRRARVRPARFDREASKFTGPGRRPPCLPWAQNGGP